MKYENIFDTILDENCTDTIYLEDEKKNLIAYEQIAIIPYDNKMYAILAEKEAYEQGLEDCGEVFLIDEKAKKIKLVNNINIISAVFEILDRMYEELGD